MNLDDVFLTSLKRIPTDGGDVMHALRESDSGFNGFGEVYFSWVEKGAIKAWKFHHRMTLNLVVPVGEIRFVFHSTIHKNFFRTETIGKERYARLTVPPKIWFGFQGVSSAPSLLMNLANIEHDPDEVIKKPLSHFNFNWRSK